MNKNTFMPEVRSTCYCFPCVSPLECGEMLQESGESDFSSVPAARNHQPSVCVPATERQCVSNGIQSCQCRTAIIPGHYNINFVSPCRLTSTSTHNNFREEKDQNNSLTSS